MSEFLGIVPINWNLRPMAYFDYRQRNQFEWAGPVILFACLVFTLTAPLYIWTIVGV